MSRGFRDPSTPASAALGASANYGTLWVHGLMYFHALRFSCRPLRRTPVALIFPLPALPCRAFLSRPFGAGANVRSCRVSRLRGWCKFVAKEKSVPKARYRKARHANAGWVRVHKPSPEGTAPLSAQVPRRFAKGGNHERRRSRSESSKVRWNGLSMLTYRPLKRTRGILPLPSPGTPVPGFPIAPLRGWCKRVGISNHASSGLGTRKCRRHGIGKPGMAMPGRFRVNRPSPEGTALKPQTPPPHRIAIPPCGSILRTRIRMCACGGVPPGARCNRSLVPCLNCSR